MFDGGPGADVVSGYGAVSYASRSRPVHVDLRRHGAVQGAAGEHDTIQQARIVYGGHASDVLIAGGLGADLFERIGTGDVVRARDGRRDEIRCSRAPSRVNVDRRDVVRHCPAGRVMLPR